MISKPVKKNGRNMLPANDLKLIIHNDILDEVYSFKFLGVIFENNLSWAKHVAYLSTKTAQTIGIKSRIRYKINNGAMMHIYNALIESHLNYCNIIWGNTRDTVLNPLYALQKKALKIALYLLKKTSTNTLF